MGVKKKELTGLITVALLLVFAIVFISLDMINDDEKLNEIDTGGKISDTKIFRDEYGIAHIHSPDMLKAYFSLGFTHAQDRLFQIEFIKRAGQGRLSELYGESHVGFDKFIRTFDLDKLSESQFQNADDKSKTLLAYYTEGVNKYIEEHKGKFQMEFGLYEASPELWKPYTPFLIYNFYALTKSKHLFGDIIFSSMRKKLPTKKLLSILSNTDYEQIKMPFFDETPAGDSTVPTRAADTLSNTLHRMSGLDILDLASSLRQGFGKGGCNLLIKRVDRDSTTTTVLVNDMHSTLLIPQEYYPVLLKTQASTIAGISLVGTPIFLTGRNDSISWGRTYIQGDDVNYHQLSVDENKMVYSWEDVPSDQSLKKLELEIDTIHIKGKPDLYYYKRIADGKYLLPDNRVFLSNQYNGTTHNLRLQKALIPVWGMDEDKNPIAMNHQLTLSDNLQSRVNWNLQGQPTAHIAVASENGALGAVLAGDTLTFRPELTDVSLDEDKISGLGEGLIQIRDDRYISSSFESKLPASVLYENNSRKDRLSDLIDESVSFTFREADMISHDLFSGYYFEFSKLVTELIKDNTTTISSSLEESLLLLEKWNGIATSESQAFVLLEGLQKVLHHRIIEPNFDKVVGNYLWEYGISDRLIINMLSKERYQDLFGTTKLELTQSLVSYFEANQKKITYSNDFIIPSTFGGIDGDTNILDEAYSIDVQSVNGSMQSVNYLNLRRTVPSGLAYRFIADMGTRKVQISMPSGASGNLTSPYYDNLFQYWKIGGTVTLNMDNDISRMRLETEFE